MSEFTSSEDTPSLKEPAASSSDRSTATAPCAAILEDHAFIKDDLPKASILTLTAQFVTVVIMRTPYSRVQLRIQYLANYPEEAPIVELTSPTLPPPLLRNKEKECMDKAKQHLGKPQVKHIYELVYNFIQTNMFVPCWRELKQVIALCEGKGQLGADEKTGVFQMRLKEGNFSQSIKLKVPPMYPEEGVEIEFGASNYPADIQFMFRSQAEEIVRRCLAGFSAEMAVSDSNPIELPNASKQASNTAPKMTTESIKNLKHDVNVLKQMSDLRVATEAKDKKYQYFTQGNAERREARKDLRRLAKAESAADAELEKKLKEEEQAQMVQLMRAKISDVAQPSLLIVAKFLVNDYAVRLPRELCQACQKPVLPENPEDESLRNPRNSRRPMRVYCGHWLHHRCLDQWLTTPPFVRQCPVCDRRIWHPDWPADYKVLEKAYLKAEERKREMSDVSDFLSMGEEFTTAAAKSGKLG